MGDKMSKSVFRKSSIERVSSPEQLNEYIRVTNPGIWLILTAIVVLLAGVCVWGVMGHLDTTLSAVAVTDGGVTEVFIKEADISYVSEGDKVTVGDVECSIISIPEEPFPVDENMSEYALHIGSLEVGQWVYRVTLSGELDDGVREARIVTESVSPISFVIN